MYELYMENIEGLFQIEYSTDRATNKPIIWLFSRGKNREKKIHKVTGFEPYCYLPYDEITQDDLVIAHEDKDVYIGLFNEKLKKVYINHPKDMYELRNLYTKIWESDVLFTVRYAIDNIEKIDEGDYRIMFFDTETTCDSGFPEYQNPIESIIAISTYDNYTKQVVTFVWRADSVVRDEQVENGVIHHFNSEVNMLEAFIKHWDELGADIITAWNINFDMKYLIARLLKLGIEHRSLSPLRSVFIPKEREEKSRTNSDVVVKGIVLLDLLSAYKKLHFGELEGYNLNAVAQLELGEQKDKNVNTSQLWRADLNALIKYNRKDVTLMVRINDKVKVISIFDYIRRFACLPNLNDCFYASRLHETNILRKYHNKIVFPSKAAFVPWEQRTHKLEGGYVKEPKTGIYDNVVVLDVKGLYPNLIYTFNLSTECIVPKAAGKETAFINNTYFKQSPKGVIPSIVQDLVRLKADCKRQVAGTGQDMSDKMFAIKTFINSIYGVQGLNSFRLFNPVVASTITWLGRTIVRQAEKIIEREGYNVLYMDTDSVFVQISADKDIVAEGKRLQDIINEWLTQFALENNAVDPTLEIEFEKVFSKLILVSKKRYVGHLLWEDDKFCDKIKTVGVEIRRTDSAKITKDVLSKIYEMIFANNEASEIVKYVIDIICNVKKGKYEPLYIAIPNKLNKTTESYNQNIPKIRAVNWSNKNLKTQFRGGTKFYMIYVRGINTDVVCFEENEQLNNIKINYDMVVEKNIVGKVKLLFEAIGWQKHLNEIIQYNKQQTLLKSFVES